MAGLFAGVFLSALLAPLVLAGGDYEFEVASGIGADLGRTAMQYATDQALDDHRIPLALAAVLQVPLWIGLLGAPLLARRRGLRWRRDLGLRQRWYDVPSGLVAGIVLQTVVVPLLYVPIFELIGDQDVGEAARSLVGRADGWVDIAALVVMVVVGAPVVEEIFFRGLLHRAVAEQFAPRGRVGVALAIVVSSTVFAASHLQPVQFPALFVVGVVTASMVQRTGRLGPAVWTHVGFNATTVVILLGG